MEEVCERKCVCLLLFLVTEFTVLSRRSWSDFVVAGDGTVRAIFFLFSLYLPLSLPIFAWDLNCLFGSPRSSRRRISFICPSLAFDDVYALLTIEMENLSVAPSFAASICSLFFCESTLCPDIKFSILRRI